MRAQPIPYAALFGVAEQPADEAPPKREADAALPPVPANLYGMQKAGKTRAEYSALCSARRDLIVAMLRSAGPLGCPVMAVAFGIIDPSMYKEVKRLEAEGRVRPIARSSQPILWQAVAEGGKS